MNRVFSMFGDSDCASSSLPRPRAAWPSSVWRGRRDSQNRADAGVGGNVNASRHAGAQRLRRSAIAGIAAGIVAVIVAGAVWAQEPNAVSSTDLFFAANQKYQAGDFQGALDGYEQIVGSGIASGAVYYNIGNAYYRLGNLGKAYVNYKRAYRLIPHDEDLFASMALVRSLFKDAQPVDQLPWYETAFVAIRDGLSEKVWVIVACCVYVAGIVLINLTIVVPAVRQQRWVMWVTGTCVLCVLCFAGASVYVHTHERLGVIVEDEVTVRYSPSFDGATAFKVHEGIEARVMRQENDWVQIRVSRGKGGWVPKGSVEEV